MTTPERLRARQRRESIALAGLALALVVFTVYFRVQASEQSRCFRAYIAQQSSTSAVRSRLVEQESLATRSIISGALTAESRADIIAARDAYFTSLSRIDKARDENPVAPPFDPDSC